MVKENAVEMKDIAHALARPASDPLVTATVVSPKGEKLQLVYEDGRWKLDGSINLYGQSTPQQSVEAFLRAFERKRYDVMIRFVPDGHMEGLDADKLRAAWEGSQKEEMARIAAVGSRLPASRRHDRCRRAPGAPLPDDARCLGDRG